MSQGWQIKDLDKLAVVVNGGTPKTKVEKYWRGNNLWVTPAEMGKRNSPFISETQRTLSDEGLQNCSASLVPANSVIMSTRAPIGHLVINTEPMAFNQGCRGMIPSDELDVKYLYYFLLGNIKLLNDLGTGATFKELSAGKLKSVSVPYPSLHEQKRIVAILDEAFAGIDTAIANTEKNLANARELFESYLNSVFTRQDDGWFSKKFSECLRLKSGDGLTSKQMVPGEFLVFGGNGVAGTHNTYNLTGDNVIIGRVGALCGNVRNITENIWLTDNAFKVFQLEKYMDNKFLTYLLNFKNLRSYARQAAQPVISNSSLKDIELIFPESKRKQKLITEKLDEISSEIDRLEIIYQQKLNSLKELKQSLLQKAFSGELTSKPDKLIDEAVA